MHDFKLSQYCNCIESSTIAGIPFRNSDSIIRNAQFVDSPQSTKYIDSPQPTQYAKSPITVDKISLVLPNGPTSRETQVPNTDTYTEPVRPFWTVTDNQPNSREPNQFRQTFEQYGIHQPIQGTIPTKPISSPCNHIHSQKLVLDQVVPHYWYSLNSGIGTDTRRFNIGIPIFQLKRDVKSYVGRLMLKYL